MVPGLLSESWSVSEREPQAFQHRRILLFRKPLGRRSIFLAIQLRRQGCCDEDSVTYSRGERPSSAESGTGFDEVFGVEGRIGYVGRDFQSQHRRQQVTEPILHPRLYLRLQFSEFESHISHSSPATVPPLAPTHPASPRTTPAPPYPPSFLIHPPMNLRGPRATHNTASLHRFSPTS